MPTRPSPIVRLALAVALCVAGAWWALGRDGAAGDRDALTLPRPSERPAQAREAAPGTPPTPRQGGGSDRALGALRPLRAAALLEVTARRADGGALPADLRLELEGEDGRVRGERLADPSAAARFELEPGRWRVTARAAGLRSPTREVRVASGARAERVELELLASGALLVCAEHADGSPAAQLEVFVVGPSGEETRSARTDADGCVRFEDLLAGPHRIALGHATHPWLEPHGVELAGALTQVAPLRLPPVADLAVRVVDDAGLAVGGARVRAIGRRGGDVEALSDPRGDCVLRALPLGLVRVQAGAVGVGQGDLAHDHRGPDTPALVLRLRPRKGTP